MVGRRVWLVRHGYREDYVHPRWPQTASHLHDPPLSTEGQQQAQDLVAAFAQHRPARVFVSPYLRTLQTVQPLAQAYALPLNVEIGIGEIHQASTDCWRLSADERKRWIPQIDQTYRSKAALTQPETSQMAKLRAAITVEKILQDVSDDLLFITHETPIQGIVSHLLTDAPSVRCTFCGITELEQQNLGWRLIRNGDVSHLSTPIHRVRFIWDYIRRKGIPKRQTRIQTL